MKISRKILFALAAPLELVPQPYAAIAGRLGMEEARLLAKIREYKKGGLIRRVGTVLGHFKVGYKCNALVCWQVNPSMLEATGGIFAGFPQVTHCYARKTYPDWPYNLYTMVHAKNIKESRAVIRAMADKAGVTQYDIQLTLKEFKKIKSDLKEILS